MTIKEAIKTIELAIAEVEWVYPIDYAAAFDVAISALRAKQENPSEGWISVKDKLPDDDQEVILCTRETETYGKHREKKKIYKNIYIGYFDGYEWLTSYCHGCEYIFKMNEKYPNETIEVTHWMPLPEPAQEV